MEDIIDIIVTETTNTIEITAQPNDEIIDVNIIDNREDIVLNVTPTVVEININSLTGNFGINWGDIDGTLSNQTDLQNALNLKADLVDGKVPSTQLPSYVDDIVEVATYSALPTTGETGKIYVVLDTNLIYRWSGSAYIEIKDSSAVWGAITGTLSSQTDLQSALDAKLSTTTASSTYVPYTGATTNVVLGTNDLTSRYITANGNSGAALGGVINIKQDAVYIPIGNGYSSIASSFVAFDFFGYAGASTYKNFTLRFDGLTNNTRRQYTLPDADGTLALTSDIPSLSGYVPYTGATTNVNLGSNNITAGIAIVNQVKAVGSGGLSINSNNGTQIANLGGGGGANMTLYGGLSGTSISLSSSLTASSIIKSGGTSSQFLKADGSVDSNTYALDSAIVHNTGAESIAGIKTFTSGNKSDYLWIKEGTGFANPSGYAQLATDITYFHFNNSNNTAYARFLYGSGQRTYTLPSSDGTLALTSALSSYLTLSGGTLTGALSGTSATFSGAVSAGGNISYSSGSAFYPRTTSVTDWFLMKHNSSLDRIENALGTNNPFTIGSYSGTTYTPNIFLYAGGAATFSGALDGNIISANSAGSTQIFLKSTGTGSNRQWQIQSNETAAGDLSFMQSTAAGGSTYATKFNLSPSGAATFSSSVKVNGTPIATSGILSVVTSTSTLGATADLGLLITNDGTAGKLSQIGFGYSESMSAAVIGGVISNGAGSTTSDLFFATRTSTTGSVAPTERMRITSAGNVGIGTTSPSAQLQVSTNSTSQPAAYIEQNAAYNGLAVTSSGNSGTYYIANFRSTGVDRMRILDNGTLAIAGSSDVNNGTLDKISIGHLSGSYGWIQTWNATNLYLNKVGNAVYAGTQRIDNNSDARIKSNIQNIENALETVLSLSGKKFNMLDENNILRYGFIAQEVQPHLNDFVTQSDRKFEKGNVKIENLLTLENSGSAWGALLVEAIKELKSELDTLKNK